MSTPATRRIKPRELKKGKLDIIPIAYARPLGEMPKLIGGDPMRPIQPLPYSSLQGFSIAEIDELTGAYGYHKRHIARGVFGEASKIQEEVEEFMDANNQGVKVMELVELSDLIGAIEGYLGKHHPGVTLHDLLKMKDVTHRAFSNGHRHARP